MEPSLISTIILSAVGFAITVYYSIHAKSVANDQMMKQLFTEFNKRYDKLNNALHEIEKSYSTLSQLEAAPNADELKQKVIDYFSLCAEEFYWYHHKKRIDPIVWKSWKHGMNYWYGKVPAIKEMWEKEIVANGKSSYYITGSDEFFE